VNQKFMEQVRSEGRSPWTAADALVGLVSGIGIRPAESRTQGIGAGEGALPTKTGVSNLIERTLA